MKIFYEDIRAAAKGHESIMHCVTSREGIRLVPIVNDNMLDPARAFETRKAADALLWIVGCIEKREGLTADLQSLMNRFCVQIDTEGPYYVDAD